MSYAAARFAVSVISASGGGIIAEAGFAIASGAAAFFDSRIVASGEVAISSGASSPNFVGRGMQAIGGEVAIAAGSVVAIDSGTAPLSAVATVAAGSAFEISGEAVTPSAFSVAVLPNVRIRAEWAAIWQGEFSISAGGNVQAKGANITAGSFSAAAGSSLLARGAAVTPSQFSIQSGATANVVPDFVRQGQFAEKCGASLSLDGAGIDPSCVSVLGDVYIVQVVSQRPRVFVVQG